MADEIEYTPLEGPPARAEAREPDLHHLHDVPVELAVEIGRTRMTIGETLKLGPGAIVSLNRLAGEPVDLLVNGKPIARGEVVVIDEEFGLRITDVVSAAERVAGAAEPPALEPPPPPIDDPALAGDDEVAAFLAGAPPPLEAVPAPEPRFDGPASAPPTPDAALHLDGAEVPYLGLDDAAAEPPPLVDAFPADLEVPGLDDGADDAEPPTA